jgi:hypothetical protein
MIRIFVTAVSLWVVLGDFPPGWCAELPPVDFSREIRPILFEYCVKCHGPDQLDRQAGLRLDTKEGALAKLESGGFAIVPGDSASSKLYQRITTDFDERMPPPDFGKTLSQDQIQRLKRWIDEGAAWDNHWAYLAPIRPRLPQVSNSAWPRNAIDNFIFARLESEGLSPAAQADPARLIRRLTLDVTGLPPTPEETDAFLADQSADAYEKLVDRLLSSPRYGERMALQWLDLARYADTHGYHGDSHRDMWRWREWVIDAMNDNLPFDQFTIWQLAGDLLPDATLEQRIATGFNRNNMVNFENGAIAEEYLTEYVVDRVLTTSTVWLGQTMRCARCHDHKYDPFTQRDFYRLFAFFNNVPEQGLDGRKGNAVPYIAAPTRQQQRQLDAYRVEIAKLEKALQDRQSHDSPGQSAWERRLAKSDTMLKPPTDMLIYYPLDEFDGEKVLDASGTGRHGRLVGSGIWISGKFGDALLCDGETYVDLGDTAALDRTGSFSVGAWLFPTTGDRLTVLARREDSPAGRGYALFLDDSKLHVNLTHSQNNAIQVHSKTRLALSKWHHVMVAYDGSSTAAGVKIYANGDLQPVEVTQDNLTDNIDTTAPLYLGGGSGGNFRGMIDDVRIYARQLSAAEVGLLSGGNPIRDIVLIRRDSRSPQQADMVRKYYLENEDDSYKNLQQQLADVRRQCLEIEKHVTTTMVMQEMEQPRQAFVLDRGLYNRPLNAVTPGTPACLPPMPAGTPANRLGLAQWLVDPQNPLTARVTVNRLWQTYFGTGLVGTPEDFGTRGQYPSHPELLDWLATELIRSGWDLKHVHKLIVTSATYRQSSRVSPDQWQRDPRNRLLSRGPRMRLDAETIRDNALFISGLLYEKIGGPSVYPYQPPGLWEEVSYNPNEFTAQVYVQSHGRDLYRRSLYIFWKRAVPPPSMVVLDAPDRITCTVSRSRTNTPLQALVLMNDPTYVEASRALAQRMMKAAANADQRIRFGFRLATSRDPNSAELQVLLDVFEQQHADYQRDPESARALLTVGESQPHDALDISELAALTTIASMILNLDEVITKN